MSALRAGNLQIVPKKSENCRRCAPGDPPPDFPTHIEYVSAAFYSIQHGWPVRRGAVTRVYLHPPRLRPPGSGAPPRGCTARWHRGCALAADDASEGWARRSRAARRGCAAPATRLTTRCAACTTRCAAMLCSRASSVSGRDAAWAATSGSESMRLSGESRRRSLSAVERHWLPLGGHSQLLSSSTRLISYTRGCIVVYY
jgi:hypothetical protein